MFGRKKKEKEEIKFTKGEITIINYLVMKKGINYPVRIIDFIELDEIFYKINYFFKYYGYSLNLLSDKFHLRIYFINRKKRLFIKTGPYIKNKKDFIKKFVLFFIWVFFMDIFFYFLYVEGFVIWYIVVLSASAFLLVLSMTSVVNSKTIYLIFIFLPVIFTVDIFSRMSNAMLDSVLFLHVYFAIIFSLSILVIREHLRELIGEFFKVGGTADVFQEEDNSQVGVINVYKSRLENKQVFLECLYHELDHILWRLEGKKYDYTNYYSERPHEKRAYEREKEWSIVG